MFLKRNHVIGVIGNMMFLTVALETTGITHNYDMKDEIFKES
jgi:hypothetical protein